MGKGPAVRVGWRAAHPAIGWVGRRDCSPPRCAPPRRREGRPPPLLTPELEIPLGSERVRTKAALALGERELAVDGSVDLEPLLTRVGPWLEREVERWGAGCEQRVDATDGAAKVIEGAVELRVSVRFERWKCKGGRERRIMRQQATVIATPRPKLIEGRPRLRSAVRMVGLSGCARIAGIDDRVKREVRRHVARIDRALASHATLARLEELGYALTRYELEAGPSPRLHARLVGPIGGMGILRVLQDLYHAP